MNNLNPVFHVSIYYPGCSESISILKKQLTAYSKKLKRDPDESAVSIRLDSLDAHAEKCIQQELTYDTVVSYSLNRTLKSAMELYTTVILLISLERQRLYEINPSTRIEDWMMISLILTDMNNPECCDYDIQWKIEAYNRFA